MKPYTIAAISTPPGVGGIAVIRLSGPEARAVAGRVFRPFHGSLEQLSGYSCLYGRVYDAQSVLDDAILTLFTAPRSYTGEDVVELSVHGGSFLSHAVLEAVLSAGARMAEPGEFTRRACENGKLSLTEAEAVADLIGAEGRVAARAALSARDGALYRALEAPTQALLSLDAHFSAYIDFPEEDVPALRKESILEQLGSVQAALTRLLSTERPARQLRQGISAVIVGRPNVGKSSLMNLLAGCRRSIVTAAPGTTRDVVEEYVSLDGLTLRLADTAGIRETEDPIEQQGVLLAEERLREADLVLAVFDLSSPPEAADQRVLQGCADVSRETLQAKDPRRPHESGLPPVIGVFNKSDLAADPEMLRFREQFSRQVTVSAEQGEGVDALWQAVREAARLPGLDPEAAMLANQRQKQAAEAAQDAVSEAIRTLQEGWTLDVVSLPVREALNALLELRGDSVTETVLDAVFSRFCVGK